MIFSAPGIPTMGVDLKKIYFRKGEKIEGFTVPFNFTGSTTDIFYRFGLWQSTNGICVEGVNHKPIYGGKYKWVNDLPILCGDKILGESVKKTYNKYNTQTQKRSIKVVEYGMPELKKITPESDDELAEIIDSIDNLGKNIDSYFDDFFNNVLAAVQTTQGPLILDVARPLFLAKKQQFLNNMAEIKQKLKEKEWH